MSGWTSINYKGFYDVPRTFILYLHERQILFDCVFDEAADDYPDAYQVYWLPDLHAAEREGSWENLTHKAIAFLGEIPVREVRFDPSRRRAVETQTLEAWGARHGWWELGSKQVDVARGK